MSDKKFLTVMAIFDGYTQEKLSQIQSLIIQNVGEGTQTMGIPFHLTLGSYPPAEQSEVVEKIEGAAQRFKCFGVELSAYNSFGDRVLFLEPDVPRELLELRGSFERDYANGFAWVPHATLFCGEVCEVQRAMALLPELKDPIRAKIVGLELGEFFPAKKITRVYFQE